MRKLLFIWLLCLPMALCAQDWQDDFKEVMALAQKEDKPIILVFSGSDWCAPCIKLDKEIWQSDEFKAYAKQNYILYKADFPRKKENRLVLERATQNKSLADNYNPKGYFPLVLVLDKNGKILGETGYQKTSPKAYIALLNSFGK
ncbi:thiol-disulfide isomerase [Sediminicola sp. YIK13]|uniref:thioredoxin family protein n=1 Tax=Sediminicola sp. YIK13 TaxID=1453352 RepID=UPI000721FDA4|nr:thioredoxin family protein [Sediminicola sp. YIK13]ALM07665.1 thiol-disulfide isomerase [Sediminicola sp. YIK13]